MRQIIPFAIMAFASLGSASTNFDLDISSLRHAVQAGQYPSASQWKVGDKMNYQIVAPIIGKVGTMYNEITKDEGDGIWLRQHTLIGAKDDIQDMLVDKMTGDVKKYVVNGQEQEYDNDVPQVLSQKDENITVPAGKFKCIHELANTNRTGKINLWYNSDPTGTPIDGLLKTLVGESSGVMITLTSFVRGK